MAPLFRRKDREAPTGPGRVAALLLHEALAAENGYDTTGREDDLEFVIMLWTKLVSLASEQPQALDSMAATCWQRLGYALYERYSLHRNREDLDQAIQCYERAERVALPGDDVRLFALSNLAIALRSRGEPGDLDRAIETGRRVLSLTPAGDPTVPTRLSILGAALTERATRTGEVADAQAAVTAHEQAVATAGLGSSDTSRFLNRLGESLTLQAIITGDSGLLDRAEETLRLAHDRAGSHDGDRRNALDNLRLAQTAREQIASGDRPGAATQLRILEEKAMAAQVRFERTGAPEALDELISAQQAIVDDPALAHQDADVRAECLHWLAQAYLLRAASGGAAIDLDAAVAAAEEAVVIDPDGPRAAAHGGILGTILQERYGSNQDMTDLTRSLEVLEGVAKATAGPVDDLAALALGRGLLLRYRAAGDKPDLLAAVDVLEAMLARLPSDSPLAPTSRAVLGDALLESYKRSHIAADLERAMVLLTASPATDSSLGLAHRSQVGSLFSLLHREAIDAEERFLERRTRADLDFAIAAWRGLLRLTDEGNQLEGAWDVICRNRLGWALRERHDAVRVANDLDEAITCFEEALRRAPSSYGDTATILGNLAGALRARNVITGDIRDLDRAVQLIERALELPGPEDPAVGSRRSHLEVARLERAIAAGDVEGGTAATAQLAVVSEGSPGARLRLMTTLAQRFERTSDSQQLKRVVEVALLALSGSVAETANLSSVGSWLQGRYELSGARGYLDEAIPLLERAVAGTSEGTPEWSSSVHSLALALYFRYGESGDADDLERAIHALEDALAVPGSDRVRHLNELGTCLRDRYRASGNVEDLDRAIGLHLEAANLLASNPSNQAVCLNSLGNGLRDRYDRTGDVSDLSQAIRGYEQALAHTDAQPLRATLLTNLANGLTDRYQREGGLADLDRAVTLLEDALASTPLDSPKWWLRADNLCSKLQQRHARSGSASDLDRAIDLSRRAIEQVPARAPGRPLTLGNLATGLLARYDARKDSVDLDTAISTLEEAVRAGTADWVLQAGSLLNLGIALGKRYGLKGDASDLDRAVECVRQSLALHPEHSPHRATVLANLSGLLERVYRRSLDPGALASTLDACRSASDLQHPAAVLNIGQRWGALAAEHALWDEAAAAYVRVLEAAERLVRTQVLRTHKESELRLNTGMATRAAFALACTEDARAAVLALERGRALLLSEALERSGADVEQLRVGRPDLHERYREAAERLRQLEGSELGAHPTSSPIHRAEALRDAREELEAVTVQIRAVPGYERFLDPPNFADVEAAAADGPLAYLAAAESGGVGFIVNSDDVKTLRLPQLSEGKVREAVGRYLGTYYAEPHDWPVALEQTSRWLWDVAIGPLLDALGTTRRLTLVPMGLLGLLPLHAAWTPDAGTPTRRRYALDEVTLSYAPNARSLNRGRNRVNAPDGLLGVADPTGSLVHASREVQSAIDSLGAGRLVADASPPSVLRLLREYGVWHFACHGMSNPTDPLVSGLVLKDGQTLTLREILRHPDVRARLAVLSACETAMPGVELPDEVVSLPAGFLQAGAAGVIGSLWRVNDASTAMLMGRFYDLWRGGEGLHPAEALRRAQQWVRDSTNDEKAHAFPAIASISPDVSPETAAFWASARSHTHPQYWAAFTYIG